MKLTHIKHINEFEKGQRCTRGNTKGTEKFNWYHTRTFFKESLVIVVTGTGEYTKYMCVMVEWFVSKGCVNSETSMERLFWM